MSKKYSYEEVKEIFNENGFDLLSNEYENCQKQLLCQDKNGYKMLISLDKLQNRKIKGSKFHKFNPYTINNINIFSKINNLGSKCIATEYENAKTEMPFVCSCGEIFHTSWNTFHSLHKTKCDNCSNNPFANKDYNYIKNELLKHGYYLDVNQDEYLGVTLTPLYVHDDNGYKYKLKYDAVLRGQKPDAISKNNPFAIDNINTFLKNNNKEFICVSEQYMGRDYLLEFKCLKCGEPIFSKWKNMNKKDNTNRSIIKCLNCDGRTESIHALVLKQMFKHYYPDTIEEETSCINPITGCILPTDIVNHRLKMAIEIQSEWHDREYQKIKDKIKKEFWINKGYKFYDPDIRDYSVLEMCQLFFDIKELPDYINYEYSNKLNIKKAQDLLNNNIPPKDVANILSVNVHVIYDALGYGKLFYSDNYTNQSYTPIVKIENNIVTDYMSIKEGAESNNLKPGSLCSALLEGRHEFGGYIWYYKKDYDKMMNKTK